MAYYRSEIIIAAIVFWLRTDLQYTPYLGIALPIDGIPGFRRRNATASKYLDDFGVAMYCGFGRQPGEDGSETMRQHRETVRSRAE